MILEELSKEVTCLFEGRNSNGLQFQSVKVSTLSTNRVCRRVDGDYTTANTTLLKRDAENTTPSCVYFQCINYSVPVIIVKWCPFRMLAINC